MSRVPVHPLVNVRQLERRFKRSDMRRVGEALRGPFKDETYEVRSLNQEWDEQETLHGDVDATLDSQLSKMLVGKVQLAVDADTVNKVRKFQELFSAHFVLLDVRIFRVDGAEPSVRQ